MKFGLRSDNGDEEAWFDYFRVEGVGPDWTSLLCTESVVCGAGTTRAGEYISGSGEESVECVPCAAGKMSTTNRTLCDVCSMGTFARRSR